MMRVGRITTVYEVLNNSKSSSNQNLGGGEVQFADILQQQLYKLNTAEDVKVETQANESLSVSDKLQLQTDTINPEYLGLYNSTARIYVDGILGTMQYHDLITPEIQSDTEEYDSVEGVYRSNKN